ncbi:MAG: hypothetical protein V4726_04970 [Verrucomicrobiota bacterium]
MKAVSGKRLAKLAEQHGWELPRITGSYHYLYQGRENGTVGDPDSWGPFFENRTAEQPDEIDPRPGK